MPSSQVWALEVQKKPPTMFLILMKSIEYEILSTVPHIHLELRILVRIWQSLKLLRKKNTGNRLQGEMEEGEMKEV